MARRSDWILRLLAALSALALVAALVMVVVLILFGGVPQSGARLMPLGQIDNSIFTTLASLTGGAVDFSLPSQVYERSGYFSLVSLLGLALVLMLAARWRAASSRGLWQASGCPSCHNGSLQRIRRRPLDRLVALSGVPTGRYRCKNCRWEGRRVRNRPAHRPDKGSAQVSSGVYNVPLVLSPGRDRTPQTRAQSAGDAAYAEGEGPALQKAVLAEIAGQFSVKLRTDPRFDADIAAMVEPGEMVALLEMVEDRDGLTWQQVRAGDRQGWIRPMYLLKRTGQY